MGLKEINTAASFIKEGLSAAPIPVKRITK
jgi:hypothetical protein